MKQRRLFIIFILLFVLSGSGRIMAQSTISYEEACADIDYYFWRIDLVHPDMYWHTPKQVVDSFITALKERLPERVSVNQLGYELQQSNHFWDYHTGIYFYPKGKEKVFPMTDLCPEGLFLEGKKILSVNNVEVGEIYRVLNNMKGCDMPLPTFFYYYNCSPAVSIAMYGLGIRSPFRVVYEGGEVGEVEGVFLGDLQYSGQNEGKPYDFRCYPADSIAIIYFDECIHELKELDVFLAQTFHEIREAGIKNLFVDVSRNPGGTSRAADLFLKYIRFNRKKQQKIWLKKGKVSGEKKICSKFYYPPEQANAFEENIFIYQSYATRSAGTWLVEVLSAVSRAVIAGTPTEATLPVYIDGDVYQLPNSKFYFQISKKFIYKEKISIPRTKWGGLLPAIEYPFLKDRRLNVDDCKKIIELNRNKP